MTELTDLSETDGDNVLITGANIAEGCPPSGINNAIRNLAGLIRRAFKASIFRLRDSTDQTKLLAFDLSGITTGTTRTLTVQDRSGTLLVGPLQLLHVRDEKSSGTPGGSSSVGFVRRTLNTVVLNEISGASLGSDQVTLPAGSYYAEFRAPAHAVIRHKAVLRNVTAGTNIFVGSSELNSQAPNSQTSSVGACRFTLAGETQIDIGHYTANAVATSGLGAETSSGVVEVYSDLKVWKVA